MVLDGVFEKMSVAIVENRHKHAVQLQDSDHGSLCKAQSAQPPCGLSHTYTFFILP